MCRPSNFCFAERVSRSLLGSWTLIEDVPNERLQTCVLERLAEDERLCNWVVVRQPPRSQPDDVTRRFLSVGGCEEFGTVWKRSKCERGDLGVGGERLKWCRSKDIDRGCPPEQYGQQMLKEREFRKDTDIPGG